MRMPFSRTRRGVRTALIVPGMGVAGAIVVALVMLLLILRVAFPGAITFLASPLWKAGSVLSTATLGASAFFTDKAELVLEQERLMVENEALEAQNAILAARAADLTRLLGTRTESEAGILAAVDARPPLSPYDTLVLDQGERAGVITGATVIGPGGIPVGTIVEVGNHYSRALLYSSPGSTNAGWVGASRLPITLEGKGAGTYEATVARESGILVGDQVFLPSSGALPIGTVVRVDTNPSSPRSRVHIRPSLNPFSITWVTVQTSAP